MVPVQISRWCPFSRKKNVSVRWRYVYWEPLKAKKIRSIYQQKSSSEFVCGFTQLVDLWKSDDIYSVKLTILNNFKFD